MHCACFELWAQYICKKPEKYRMFEIRYTTSTARIYEDEEGPSLNQVCLNSDIKESNALLDDKDAVIKDLEEKLKQKSEVKLGFMGNT
jgi:hypothetical protein